MPAENLILDADQMLSIMTFAIGKAAVMDLPGHLKLVMEFTSQEVQGGKVGQALFTVRAAVENLAENVSLASSSKFGLRSISKENMRQRFLQTFGMAV